MLKMKTLKFNLLHFLFDAYYIKLGGYIITLVLHSSCSKWLSASCRYHLAFPVLISLRSSRSI